MWLVGVGVRACVGVSVRVIVGVAYLHNFLVKNITRTACLDV